MVPRAHGHRRHRIHHAPIAPGRGEVQRQPGDGRTGRWPCSGYIQYNKYIRHGVALTCSGCSILLGFMDEVHLLFPLALRLHFAARGEVEQASSLFTDQRIGRLADVHLSHFTAALHAAGRVHGIAPDVVGELLHAHDARYHRAGVDACAHFKAGLPYARSSGGFRL